MNKDLMKPCLHGITVLELGLAEAGQYCGRLLAELGADVITVEPLEGISTRNEPPYVVDKDGRRRSVVHEYLNSGKQSLCIDLNGGLLGKVLKAFEGRAQLILTSAEHAHLIPKDIKFAVLSTSFSGAPVEESSPTTPLTRFVAGGSGSLMPTSRPVMPGTLAGECFSGIGLATTALAMLLMQVRATTTQNAKADHCERAHLVNLEKMFLARISKDKADVNRETHKYPFGGAVKCKDGFVSMLINEKHQWRGFCEAIGKPEWATDPQFSTGSARFKMRDAIEDALTPWCATRDRAEVVAAMRGRSVPIGSVNEVDELSGNDILRARNYVNFSETPYGTGVTVRLPFGTDPLWTASISRNRKFASVIGEHSISSLASLGFSHSELQSFENLNQVRSEVYVGNV